MNQPLPGNAIVITGAFGALGAAVARAAVGNGARVGLIDRALKAPAGLLQDCGPQTIVRAGVDLTVASDASRAIDAIHADFRCLDVLINIAGAFRWQTVSDGDSETWDLMNAVNLKTALHGSRAALQHLPRPGGRIINIGANAAIKAGAGMGPYAASKAGVHRLTESLAEELKSTGITVNAVLPSIIDTAVNRSDMPGADYSKWVTPAALAAVILFLASADAQAITGALIPVTGQV
jgi:NAD(P)-dependent dehydrogenase (short-subunit alcohol dehydrogenase family)